MSRPLAAVVEDVHALVSEAETMAESIRWRLDVGAVEEALERLWRAIDDRLGEYREELRGLEAA